jgi:hypothetical protein
MFRSHLLAIFRELISFSTSAASAVDAEAADVEKPSIYQHHNPDYSSDVLAPLIGGRPGQAAWLARLLARPCQKYCSIV